MRNSKVLLAVTQGLLYALALLVAACLAAVFISPGLRAFFEEYYGAGANIALFNAFLLLAGLLALWILTELALVIRTVAGDPFVERNVSAFIRMGCAAEGAGVLFAVKCFVFFTPMTAVCAIVMLLSGLFALVLAGVFKKAVEYKRDNELTI